VQKFGMHIDKRVKADATPRTQDADVRACNVVLTRDLELLVKRLVVPSIAGRECGLQM
jgi:hypothetical protein